MGKYEKAIDELLKDYSEGAIDTFLLADGVTTSAEEADAEIAALHEKCDKLAGAVNYANKMSCVYIVYDDTPEIIKEAVQIARGVKG